jgi:hypothetical protein
VIKYALNVNSLGFFYLDIFALLLPTLGRTVSFSGKKKDGEIGGFLAFRF